MHTSEYTPLKNGGLTLLIDTDIGPDCDDAGALAVAAALAKRYRVPVGAVVSCTSSPYGAPCAEAICRFCGLEVGVFAENKQPGLLTRARNMRYNREIAERFGEKKTYAEAVAAYRRTLAALPDGGAVVVLSADANNAVTSLSVAFRKQLAAKLGGEVQLNYDNKLDEKASGTRVLIGQTSQAASTALYTQLAQAGGSRFGRAWRSLNPMVYTLMGAGAIGLAWLAVTLI